MTEYPYVVPADSPVSGQDVVADVTDATVSDTFDAALGSPSWTAN